MEKDFAIVDASVWTGNMCLYMYVMRFCFCDRGILGLVIESVGCLGGEEQGIDKERKVTTLDVA